MHKLLCSIMLLFAVGFSAQTQVVTFDNNWGENPLFNLISEATYGVEVVFSIHEMVVEEALIDGVPMKTFGVPGIFLFNDEGAPNLAGTGRYIAIPHGAQAKVTIISSRTQVYHNIEVAPSPNIPLDSDNSPLCYVKDMRIYGQNAYYPETLVKLSEPMKIRGVDVVILGFTPFQYNPATKELIVYKDIRVRVDFIGGNGHFGEDRLRSRFWESLLQGHLLNYNSLPEIDFSHTSEDINDPGYEYIIIVPDDPVFEAWGDTIKAWRRLQGISCEVFTLTEVGGSTWETIENFLNNAYNNWNPAPVAFLLLADYPKITSPLWNGYCVSDNIYADVDGDDLPDMHHGRICAQTEAQLRIMINKFLSYERDPYTNSEFYDNPLVACGWQTDRWFQLCSETIRGFFINTLGKNPARQYGICWGNPYPGCTWSTASNTATVVEYWNSCGYIPTTNPYDAAWWNNGSSWGITNAINSGAFLVQHRDHGSETGWGHPPYYNSDLDNLTNMMFPFVYSTNCLTGRYNYSGECFAEKFHRIQNGALGLNAASQSSYSFVNDTYVWGTYDGLWPEFDPGYGMPNAENLNPCMAMTYGKYYLAVSSWPYNTGNKVHTYHLFHHHGDAFTPLYSEPPQIELSVSIFGPDILGYKEVGTYIATVTGGSGSFYYDWFVKHDGGSEWIPQITHNNTIRFRNETLYGFHIRVDVTDNITHEFCSDTMYVEGEFSGGGDYLIIVISPNGGERWSIGSTHNIMWEDDVGEPHRMMYTILLSKDGGNSYDYTIGRVTEWKGLHTYQWTIPQNMRPSSQCRIKIRGSGGGESAFDESDDNFTIFPGIQITNSNAQGDEYTLVPTEFQLSSSPNPFSTSTTIRYALPKDSKALIEVYDVAGRKIATLIDDHHLAGYYSIVWNRKDEQEKEAANGIYFLRLKADDTTMTQKMLVLY